MLNQNFMLKGVTAEFLYHTVAKDAPIYDYHCHLSARDIYEDRVFENISKIWLEHDHYKWRAMRYSGIDEELITGSGNALEKFEAWATTVEKLIGSPLYHWSNLELHNYFGITETLNSGNAKDIFNKCNRMIEEKQLSPVKMIIQSGVKLICTTDDPVDELTYHKLIRQHGRCEFQVLPTFRPDKAMDILKSDYTDYIFRLESVCGKKIISYQDLLEVLKERIRFFGNHGCVMSDHSLEALTMETGSPEEIAKIFTERMAGSRISREDAAKFKLHTLILLAAEYKKMDWAMQLHIGAFRNVNSIRLEQLGVDAGYDIMNDFIVAEPLIHLLDQMEQTSGLPKTILYTLNDKDNLVLANIPQCFTEAGVPGKIQFGPAWWLCDHKEGIIRNLTAIANQGLLAYSTGMLTDSRSFLSYARHEYFRRILCNFIGEIVDEGEFENSRAILCDLVESICYKNIQKYLKLEE